MSCKDAGYGRKKIWKFRFNVKKRRGDGGRENTSGEK